MNNKEIYQVTYLIQQMSGDPDLKILPEKTNSLLFEAESFAEAEKLWFERLAQWNKDIDFMDDCHSELLEIKKLGIIEN
jgi:hypothetical protein